MPQPLANPLPARPHGAFFRRRDASAAGRPAEHLGRFGARRLHRGPGRVARKKSGDGGGRYCQRSYPATSRPRPNWIPMPSPVKWLKESRLAERTLPTVLIPADGTSLERFVLALHRQYRECAERQSPIVFPDVYRVGRWSIRRDICPQATAHGSCDLLRAGDRRGRHTGQCSTRVDRPTGVIDALQLISMPCQRFRQSRPMVRNRYGAAMPARGCSREPQRHLACGWFFCSKPLRGGSGVNRTYKNDKNRHFVSFFP